MVGALGQFRCTMVWYHPSAYSRLPANGNDLGNRARLSTVEAFYLKVLCENLGGVGSIHMYLDLWSAFFASAAYVLFYFSDGLSLYVIRCLGRLCVQFRFVRAFAARTRRGLPQRAEKDTEDRRQRFYSSFQSWRVR